MNLSAPSAPNKKPVICLLGPTASGKTALAVEIVKRFPCEIISVDSVMVYRGMNIGAAKPSKAILKIAPHHLIDILDPANVYSAGRFREDALATITAIHQRKHIPLLVGGTMLYFRILQQGLAALPTANAQFREEITRSAKQFGWQALHKKLASIDAEAAQRIHEHDGQRIMRALEVYTLTGQTITTRQLNATHPLTNYALRNIILAPQDRKRLHERIALRFAEMLSNGLVDEVQSLYARGDLDKSLPSIRSAGYAQVWSYLENQITYTDMQEQTIAATRQLAKRQMTWLKSNSFQDALCLNSDAFELQQKQIPELVVTLLQQCVG